MSTAAPVLEADRNLRLERLQDTPEFRDLTAAYRGQGLTWMGGPLVPDLGELGSLTVVWDPYEYMHPLSAMEGWKSGPSGLHHLWSARHLIRRYAEGSLLALHVVNREPAYRPVNPTEAQYGLLELVRVLRPAPPLRNVALSLQASITQTTRASAREELSDAQLARLYHYERMLGAIRHEGALPEKEQGLLLTESLLKGQGTERQRHYAYESAKYSLQFITDEWLQTLPGSELAVHLGAEWIKSQLRRILNNASI